MSTATFVVSSNTVLVVQVGLRLSSPTATITGITDTFGDTPTGVWSASGSTGPLTVGTTTMVQVIYTRAVNTPTCTTTCLVSIQFSSGKGRLLTNIYQFNAAFVNVTNPINQVAVGTSVSVTAPSFTVTLANTPSQITSMLFASAFYSSPTNTVADAATITAGFASIGSITHVAGVNLDYDNSHSFSAYISRPTTAAATFTYSSTPTAGQSVGTVLDIARKC